MTFQFCEKTHKRESSACFCIKNELGSFWGVDGFKNDFSEEKPLKIVGFNRFLPVN